MPDKEGVTFRQRAFKAYEPGDPLAPDVIREISEPCPIGLDFVWSYWLDLSRTRQSGFSSPAPLTYLELKAWSDLRADIYLNSRIVELIIQIDGVFRRVWSDRSKSEKEELNDE